MMRSNCAAVSRKAYKPPPPVPPRPSKTLVQEALAKTRQGNETGGSDPVMGQNNAKSPMRQAPPPPMSRAQMTDINKSFSSGQVNVVLKKQAAQAVSSPAYYERSLSVDKVSSRPVVYQSDNLKRHPSDAQRRPTDVTRIDSFKKVDLKRNDSVKKELLVKGPAVADVRKSESARIECDEATKRSTIDLKRVESFKKEQKPQVTVKKAASLKHTNSRKLERTECLVIKTNESIKETDLELMDENKYKAGHNENQDETKSRTSTMESGISSKMSDSCDSSSSSKSNSLDKKWDKMLNDRNHVNTLIDEMFASVLEVSSSSNSNRSSVSEGIIKDSSDNKIIISNNVENNVIVNKSNSGDNLTVIVISDDNSSTTTEDNKTNGGAKSNTSTGERKVKFNDRMNHELLINELQNMKNDQERILKRQRMPSVEVYGEEKAKIEEKIHTNDWYGVNDGKEVKMSSCHITIEDAHKDDDRSNADYERIAKMSHLHGLPPLPKSLSGFNFMDNHLQGQRPNPPTPVRTSSMRSTQITPTHHVSSGYSPQPRNEVLTPKKATNLDTQLAILRREMYSLRQQDLSLLSQLWSLNESIQDFRQMLQDQEDRVLSPPSPSPTPSSADEEEFYMSATSTSYRQSSGMVGRKLSGSSAASGSVG